VRDASAAFSALQTGEIDSLVRRVPPELVEDLEADSDIELVEIQTYQGRELYFHAERQPTADRDFRKAVALAVDREALVERVLRGRGQPGRDGFWHPDSYLAHPEDDTQFDPDAAGDLLDEAGYEVGAEGMRQMPNGDPVELSLMANSFDPLEVRSAELIAEHLSEIGVGVEVEALDPGTLSDRSNAGDYDLALGSLNNHMHMDPDAFYHFFGPGITGFTFGGYDNPEFNELMEQAAVTADWDERLDLIHQQQEFFADALPALMLYYPDEFQAYRAESYDGWFADPGHQLLTKRSFLPSQSDQANGGSQDDVADDGGGDEEVATTQPSGADDDGDRPWAWIVAAIAAIAVVGVVIGRRRSEEEDE
jgi:peptide/nickel transport system substrate-binding protein